MTLIIVIAAGIVGYFLRMFHTYVRECNEAYGAYNEHMNNLFGTDPKTKWEL